MKTANAWVLGGALLAAASIGGLVRYWVPDAEAGVSAALLGGLGALMLGGWAATRHALRCDSANCPTRS